MKPDALKSKIRNLSRKYSVNPQALMQNYFLERLLVRISKSEYQQNIILKGGMLVASIIGSELRSTMDLDATIKNRLVEENNILKMVEQIISIDANDDIEYRIISINRIIEDQDYCAFRLKIDAYLGRIIQHLKLDFSTGDKITPSEISVKYQLMFGDDSIRILAYNIETIMAEKFETVLSRSVTNTRMKDFYDLYILFSLNASTINFDILRDAIVNTAQHRGSIRAALNSNQILNQLSESAIIKNLWKNYCNEYVYAKDIDYKVLIEVLESINFKIQPLILSNNIDERQEIQ